MLKEENSMFTGDNILGTGTSAVEDLGIFMASLHKMMDQKCRTGHPAHGITIDDLNTKISRELSSKYRREKQVIRALRNLRDFGQNRPVVRDIVENIYGSSVDETTRTLALEPFIDEVLRKLAGDGKVGFQVRASQKKWFLIDNEQHTAPMRQVQHPVTRASA
jgi:hypothetical protein